MRDDQARDATRSAVVVSFRSPRALAGHALLVLGGWALFLWLWARVVARPGSLDAVASSALLLGVLLVVVTTVTWLWIVHNVALARRRAGRRAGTPPLVMPTLDGLGRKLDLDSEAARADRIVVRVEGGSKRFVAVERSRG